MEGYRKTSMLILSYAQPLALMAMLATISPISPKIKIAASICTATTAILLGEKLYNYCFKNNPGKQTDYQISKSAVGLVGIAATFTSSFKLPTIAWNIGVFTAVGAIISPIPYEWLTKSDEKNIDLWNQTKKVVNSIKNPGLKERTACITAAILPLALWSTALFIPRTLLLVPTYGISCILNNYLSSTNEPILASFGSNILKSFGINGYFPPIKNHNKTREI